MNVLKQSYAIPQGIHARFDFQQNAADTVTTKATLWGIPVEVITNIATGRSVYVNWYQVCANKKTQNEVATNARDMAWDKYEISLRALYDLNLINNPKLTDEDRTALGIHIIGGPKVLASKEIISTPVLTMVSEEISVLHAVYTDSATPGTHAKPNKVAFLEIWATLTVHGAPPPAGVANCELRFNITRNHQAISFDPEDRGKTFYGFARWVSTKGEVGVWSSMVFAFIA